MGTANSSLIPDGIRPLGEEAAFFYRIILSGKGEARTTTDHRIILSIIVPAG
jgi:hypothetical protein